MKFETLAIDNGIILAEAGLAPEPDWFDPEYWRARDAGETLGRGRGEAISVGASGEWVLRHYRRGGFPAHLLEDGYLWLGLERTRPVRELRLLAILHERGVPVPRPVAVRVVRLGGVYRGDLISVRIRGAVTLAECAPSLDAGRWRDIGNAIGCFHRLGGWHADLNAHNLLLAPSGAWLVDLDRGRLVIPGCRAQSRNLGRLRRSLARLALLPACTPGWLALLEAWRQTRTGGGA